MNIWQNVRIEKMISVLRAALNPEKIEIKGSMLNLDSIDKFSDVDLNVLLKDTYIFDIDMLILTLSSEIGVILGYQLIDNKDHDVFRVCFEKGWRFDITIKYYAKKQCLEKDSFENTIEKIINEFWFISSWALMKIGRNDYLVATHLALELCQINIVIQMLERDNKKGTNIHRFGEKESVYIPSIADESIPVVLADETANEIMGIIFQASKRMDGISTKLMKKIIIEMKS